MVDVSDSSHSGIVAGNRCPRVGLVGAEAKKEMLKADIESLAKASRLKVCLGTLVGEESGGVTGALFDIRRAGSDEGMLLWRNTNGCEEILASPRVGLGQAEDNGLAW